MLLWSGSGMSVSPLMIRVPFPGPRDRGPPGGSVIRAGATSPLPLPDLWNSRESGLNPRTCERTWMRCP
jgi:hypothetical protein